MWTVEELNSVPGRPARIEYIVVELMGRLFEATSETIDSEIQSALEIIGTTYDLCRTCFFQFDPVSGYRSTHEWIASGRNSLKAEAQGFEAALLPEWHADFLAGRVVSVTDQDRLMIAVLNGAELVGLIVAESDAPGRWWGRDDVFLLTSIARALSVAMRRCATVAGTTTERDTLARIMESSVSGIIALDAQGRVGFANVAATQILGQPVLPQDNLTAMLGAAKAFDLAGTPLTFNDLPVARALRGEPGLQTARHRIIWPCGTRRAISLTATRLSAPGTGFAVVCTLTDITLEVQNEERLRAATAEAEAANRAKSDFLSIMSHEIRTPLNGVLGMANLLTERPRGPTEQAMLAIIRDAGEHILGLVNDILDLAKIEAGKLQLDEAPMRLAEVLDRVVALHCPASDAKGLRLQAVCVGTYRATTRLGDQMRVTQILHNLIGNAIKFTDSGEVSVLINCTSPETVVIEVNDSGTGMSDAEIAGVFEAFSQGSGGSTRSHVGTGLGLPIVRRLARLMRGDITLTAGRGGKGILARVVLALPLHSAVEQSALADVIHPLPELRILAAEDNSTNRIILQSTLRALGGNAVIVPDGQSALDALLAGDFDVVLLDITMPGLDGFETLAALNSAMRAAGRVMPAAIAVTANIMTHQIDDYLDRGFLSVVAKPMRMAELARALGLCARLPGPPPVS